MNKIFLAFKKLKTNILVVSLIAGISSGLAAGMLAFLFFQRMVGPKIYPFPLIQFFPELKEKIKEVSGPLSFEIKLEKEKVWVFFPAEVKVIKVTLTPAFFVEPLPPFSEGVIKELKETLFLPESEKEKLPLPWEPLFSIEIKNFKDYLQTPSQTLSQFLQFLPETFPPEEREAKIREEFLYGIHFVAQPEVFISSFYLLGEIPPGFIETTGQKEFKITSGKWYNLTIWGVNEKNQLLWGSRNFIKKF